MYINNEQRAREIIPHWIVERLNKYWSLCSAHMSKPITKIRLGYCFTPYQRPWLYNGAPLVAFYDTLGIRRTYSRLKPTASSRVESQRLGCAHTICHDTINVVIFARAKCWQDISRRGSFHDITHISFIKAYGFLFSRGGNICEDKSAKNAKMTRTQKFPRLQ